MDEEFEKISAEIKEKASRGENVDYEMQILNKMMELKLKEAYKQVLFKMHNTTQEFLQKENHTMNEYDEIISSFDDIREKVDVDGHFYFEEIYFILDVNTLTPLITINDIDTIIILYEKFMKKAIETVETNEEKEDLKKIYNEDCSKIKSAIEDRRNNYPTIREEITKKQCLHCLRTIDIDSDYCEYCENKIENHY